MAFTIEINFNDRIEPWIDVTKKVPPKSAQITETRANKKNRYVPDVLKFNILETTKAPARVTYDIIPKIKEATTPIRVRVFDNGALYFFGTIKDKKSLQIMPNHQVYKLEAFDFIKDLDIINKTFWSFKNETLSNIVGNIIRGDDDSPTSNISSFFPPEMNTKRVNFYATDQTSTLLKIINNFLFEYGFVLIAKYFGNTPVVSAVSYWDKGAVATRIDDKNIRGKITYKKNTLKQVKLFKTNFRILGELKNILLYAEGIGNRIEVQPGNFWPENGDSEIQFQEYTIFHKDNLEKSPGPFNPNSKLDWGTINKNSEIIYASNQRVNYWPAIALGYDDLFIHTEEHYPTHSRVLLAKRVNRIYLGKEYRVVNQRFVTKQPPGCSEFLTREEFIKQNPRYVVTEVISKEEFLKRNPQYKKRERALRELGLSDLPNSFPVNSEGDLVLDSWIDDRLELHNSNLGKYTPTRFFYTKEFYPTKARAIEASAVEGIERRCSGSPIRVPEPIFEERDVKKVGDTGWFDNFTIHGDAVVSTSQGTTTAGLFDFGDSQEGDSLARVFTINSIGIGDSTDSIGRPITIMGYQFYDTPTKTGILNGYHMLTENGTYVKISNYIGDTTPPQDRWGFPVHPQQKEGVVEFQYVEGLMPVTIKDRRVVFGGKAGRIQAPVPIYDKKGTKAVFIRTGEPVEEQIEETSFLYNKQDASNFVQGVLNEASVGNSVFSYEGYAVPIPSKIIHPRIGEYVVVDLPTHGVNNERFVVNKYIRKLDDINYKTAKIELKRTLRFDEGKVYSNSTVFFPSLPQYDPEPTQDTVYAYTESNGMDPRDVANPSAPFGNPGAVRAIQWWTAQSEYYNRQNREVDSS